MTTHKAFRVSASTFGVLFLITTLIAFFMFAGGGTFEDINSREGGEMDVPPIWSASGHELWYILSCIGRITLILGVLDLLISGVVYGFLSVFGKKK